MPVGIYTDVHVPRAITIALRSRGVDVLRAQEDNAERLSDAELLDRATFLQRVLFTFDDDLLVEARKRQLNERPFSGLVYAHALSVTIGACVKDLEIIAKACELEYFLSHIEFIPL